MISKRPWLGQGDYFTSVPQPVAKVFDVLEAPVGLEFTSVAASALLLTYDCIIDKPSNKQLHFAPIYGVADLAPGQLDQLRQAGNGFANVVLLTLGHEDEGIARLDEIFSLPVAFFDAHLEEFTAHPDITDVNDCKRMAIRRNDTRARSMTPTEQDELLSKLAFFWTRAVIDPGQ